MPEAADLFGFDTRVPTHVLHLVRAGDGKTDGWEYQEHGVSDSGLWNVRRDGSVVVRHCSEPGFRTRAGMVTSKTGNPDAAVRLFHRESGDEHDIQHDRRSCVVHHGRSFWRRAFACSDEREIGTYADSGIASLLRHGPGNWLSGWTKLSAGGNQPISPSDVILLGTVDAVHVPAEVHSADCPCIAAISFVAACVKSGGSGTRRIDGKPLAGAGGIFIYVPGRGVGGSSARRKAQWLKQALALRTELRIVMGDRC